MEIFDNRTVFYIYLLLSLAVSVFISVVLYRNYNRKGFLKAVLTALRSLSLFFILLLITNPFFSFTKSDNVTPKNLILIDNSESITADNKREQIRKKLSGISDGNSVIYEFGSRLLGKTDKDKILNESSAKDRYSTNLSAAIEDFTNSDNTRINSVFIFSDGMINSGYNLIRNAKRLNAPVFYFLAGDTLQKNDVSVLSVQYNSEVYIESTSEISARIFAHGYDSNLKITLLEEDIPVQSAEIKLVKGVENYDVSFNIISESAGFKKYRITAEPSVNEATLNNNSEEFCIRFIDNNFRILVISGSPSPDFALLKQSLTGTRNFSPEFYVLKSSDSYYEGELPDFRMFDAIILSGFPSTGSNTSETEKILKGLSIYSTPLLFINASNTDYEKLKKLEEYLPCRISTMTGTKFQSMLKVRENHLFSEKFRKFRLPYSLYFPANSFSAKPDATVIAETVRENIPAVVIRNSQEHNSALLAGWNYINWNLNPSVQEKDYYQSLVSSLLSVIIKGNKKDIIRIKTEKTYYAVSEPVRIEIYKDFPESETGIDISAAIISGDKRTPLELKPISENTYQADYITESAGDYKIEVTAFKDGKMLASAEGRFIAGTSPEEFRLTRSDNTFLSQLAAETGGYNIIHSDNPEMMKISGSNEQVSFNAKEKFVLRNSYMYLFIILFLLSLEWYIRKRVNLS
ncbi:MAG: VWA domain-containing protein [Ignavibacteria bacterium]|nr:VWA domain-containing protein [Ignavibacteria bacterium]